MASISTAAIDLLVVGAGKVGLNIARLALAKGLRVQLWQPTPLLGERLKLVRTLHLPLLPTTSFPDTTSVSNLMVAVPDPVVNSVLAQVQSDRRDPRSVVLVTSGYSPLPDYAGSLPVVRFHPAFSFTRYRMPLRLLGRACVLISGNAQALDRSRHLAQTLGWRSVIAPVLEPTAYHAGCVLAANLPAACLVAASQVFAHAGVPAQECASILRSLMAVPAADVAGLPGVPRLSGPASRGDWDTLAREIHLLAGSLPHLLELFRSGNAALAHFSGHEELVQLLASWTPPPKST